MPAEGVVSLTSLLATRRPVVETITDPFAVVRSLAVA